MQVRCPQGHQWEPADAAGAAVCPTCGATVPVNESTLVKPETSGVIRPDLDPGRDTDWSLDSTLIKRPAPRVILPDLDPGRDELAQEITRVKVQLPSPAELAATLNKPQATPAGAAAEAGPGVPNYQMIEPIGRGGMGVVWKARQVKLNRVVALKMILAGAGAGADEVRRFRVEAEAVARLAHPNIVQIYEIGEHNGQPFFSLEYLPGGSLATMMSGQPFVAARAARLLLQLAEAVQYAHQQGVIHRDLKPANILLAADGTPKIADFGLAKYVNDAGQTQTGTILGTPHYMAPEQAKGSKATGPAADIYALGAILYQMLTGQPPFTADSVLSILKQVQEQEAIPPRKLNPNLPRDLQTICLKCLEKEPGRRYATAADLAADLRRFLAGEPIKARPIGTGERLVKWVKRRPELATLFLVSIFAVALFARLAWVTWLASEPARLPLYSDAEIRNSAAGIRKELFRRLQEGRAPMGWYRANLNSSGPVEIDVGPHAQTLAALLNSPDADARQRKEISWSVELPLVPWPRALLFAAPPGFSLTVPEIVGASRLPIERDGIQFGWLAHQDAAWTEAEPGLWVAIALAQVLRHPELLDETRRKRFESHWRRTQKSLEIYRPEPFAGGWNPFPRQKKLDRHNVHTSALALLALLEARRANLPWEGSNARRDELIRATAAWLAGRYNATATPPGWSYGDDSPDTIIEGLTLQVYGLLIRADLEAGVAIPDRIRPEIPLFLGHFTSRSIGDGDHEIGEATYLFRSHLGDDRLGRETGRFEWYPWQVYACWHWLQWSEREHGNPNDRDGIRRVLGHLVVRMAEPAARREVAGYSFIPAERLFCLSSIPPP
jgi:tRNA A-37 threonylcarbamoyl transferase component Bud32